MCKAGPADLKKENLDMEKYQAIADSYEKSGDVRGAIKTLQKLLMRYPNSVDLHYRLAVLYHKDNEFEKAIEHFQHAGKLNPSDATIFNNLGVLYFMLSDLQSAEKQFIKAIKLDNRYSEAFYNNGKVLLAQGNEVDAADKFRRCLELNKDHLKAKSELAHCTSVCVENIAENTRVLVVMDEGIGNMLMLTPTLRAIRKTLPSCHLAVLGRQPSVNVLRGWDVVDKVLTGPVDEEYDVCFFSIWSNNYARQYESYFRLRCKKNIFIRMDDPNRHEAHYHLKIAYMLGYNGDLPDPYCSVSDDSPVNANSRKLVALSDTTLANGAWERKRWPHYPDLAHELVKQGYDIALIGGKAEAELFNPSKWPKGIIDCLGKYDLPQTAAILQECEFFIGNDSGPAHMAAALGVPIYVLFGPSREEKNRPLGKHVNVISKNLPCSPCQYTPRWEACKDWKCMSQISVDDVLAQIFQDTTHNRINESHRTAHSKFATLHRVNTLHNFVITGTGRSGTAFLANLLDTSSQYTVIHEYDYDGLLADDPKYLQVVQNRFQNYYGEVNSHLRFIFPRLQTSKKAVIIRNPRDIILSAMNRHLDWATPKKFGWYMDRLNASLLMLDHAIEDGLYMIRFEEMISDIKCLKNLCEYLKVEDIDFSKIDLSRKINKNKVKYFSSLDELDQSELSKVDWYINKYFPDEHGNGQGVNDAKCKT